MVVKVGMDADVAILTGVKSRQWRPGRRQSVVELEESRALPFRVVHVDLHCPRRAAALAIELGRCERRRGDGGLRCHPDMERRREQRRCSGQFSAVGCRRRKTSEYQKVYQSLTRAFGVSAERMHVSDPRLWLLVSLQPVHNAPSIRANSRVQARSACRSLYTRESGGHHPCMAPS